MSNFETQIEPINSNEPSQQAELDAIERAILIDPAVMVRGIDTLIERFETITDDVGFHRTPEITVAIDGEDEPVTVFAGYTRADRFHKVIYKRDAESNEVREWIVLSRRPEAIITDGLHHPIETDVARTRVRAVLDAMKKQYEQAALNRANGFDIQKHLERTLDELIVEQQVRLARLQQERGAVVQAEVSESFTIQILTSWEREGVQPFEETVTATTLSDAVLAVIRRYKEANHVNDVLGSSVSVMVPTSQGQLRALPEEIVMPLFNALSQYDAEGAEIERKKRELPKLMK